MIRILFLEQTKCDQDFCTSKFPFPILIPYQTWIKSVNLNIWLHNLCEGTDSILAEFCGELGKYYDFTAIWFSQLK